METWKKWTAIGACAVIVPFAGLGLYIAARANQMETMINGKIEQVFAAARQAPASAIDESLLKTLPEPVQRYFRYVARQPLRSLRSVRMRLEGEFRRPGSGRWEPAVAEQYVAVTQPNFVFSEEIRMAPGVTARAMDAYVGGRMTMEARIQSAFTVVREDNVPELNRNSLLRFFIEAPLYPAALLPGRNSRWEPINDQTARLVVMEEGSAASYRVSFDEAGAIRRYDAEWRADPNQRYHGAGEVATRGNYREMEGMMIPMAFEISRVIDGEVWPFWKGRVISVDYNVFQRFPDE